MNGIDLVAKLAEIQSQYADAHRPMRSIEQYRERHTRRHPERNDDGERHVKRELRAPGGGSCSHGTDPFSSGDHLSCRKRRSRLAHL
jgi:hypothetical protein